jgi:hypothetical protein
MTSQLLTAGILFGPEPSEVGLVLPPDWSGRCNLGLESLNLSYVVQRVEVPAAVARNPSRRMHCFRCDDGSNASRSAGDRPSFRASSTRSNWKQGGWKRI